MTVEKGNSSCKGKSCCKIETPLIVGGIIFTLVALVHLYRLLTGTLVIVGTTFVPLWITVAGLVVAVLMAIWMFTVACCCHKCVMHDKKEIK